MICSCAAGPCARDALLLIDMPRKPGEWCERLLDGLGFKCKIVDINPDGTLKLEFEDGFVEDEVPPEEVQDSTGEGSAAVEAQEVGSAQVVTEPVVIEPKTGTVLSCILMHARDCDLQQPCLIGSPSLRGWNPRHVLPTDLLPPPHRRIAASLIFSLSFARCVCFWTAKKDTTYVVHGAENNVAAGSGLKGVRWLKSQS